MTQVPASSHGGGISSPLATPAPLVFSPTDKDATAIQLKPVTGATNDATDQLEWYDDTGNLLGYIDAASNVQLGFKGSGNGLFVVDLTNSRTLLFATSGAGAALNSFSTPTAITFVSGTGRQVVNGRDTHLVVPVTFNPTGLLTATVEVALSTDDVTYTVLATKTLPALAALAGLIDEISIHVPSAKYVRLTTTNATLGTGTYY